MNKKELMDYLLKEEAHAFTGWDFSYLTGRWENEILPWEYKSIILNYLKPEMNLLDMGTGGGEFLLTLQHPYLNTSVTEAYAPNIKLCEETLKPRGIKVYPVKEDGILTNIGDATFDIVINRHEFFDAVEVSRVLKKGGIFITQQVGAYNNKDLATFFDSNHIDQFPNATLEYQRNELQKNGFKVLEQGEFYPKIKFFDLGAIAFFAKIISWEFLDFSVEKLMDKFLILQEKLSEQGYIESTEHRYYVVAVKE